MKHALVSISAFLAVAQFAGAQVLATWTFESNTPADLSNSPTLSGIAADLGAGTASGFHSSAATDWTTPAGNGSANALSSNTWSAGDYYQFSVSTLGYSGISVSWDQTGSNTGPANFALSYSINGTDFTNAYSYSVINGGWSSSSAVPTTSFAFDFSGVAALNNQAAVQIRLVDVGALAINGGTVAAGGTGRVDNFSVAASAIPEPSTYAMICGGLTLGFVALRRRLRR
ncbi:MAG TPA: PEP-CTERM sorting domain-containing protein [Opitutaceae bacterium]|nr:PEP-CTERM sorting domain-containing protein [Opitutaceae bacterium]